MDNSHSQGWIPRGKRNLPAAPPHTNNVRVSRAGDGAEPCSTSFVLQLSAALVMPFFDMKETL